MTVESPELGRGRSSPEVLAALESIRDAVSLNAEKTDWLVQRIERLEAMVEAGTSPRSGLPSSDPDAIAALESGLAHLGKVIAGTGESVHAHQMQIGDIRRRLDRLQGALLDQTALNRRLAALEDRISAMDSDAGRSPTRH